jgi:hypothetical protein
MNTVKCNAKDPSSCRYHRPDASVIALAQLEEARSALVEAQRRSDIDEDKVTEELDARWNVDQAEEVYYATEAGIADIKAQMANETNPNEKFMLEMKLASAQYAMADVERINAINERNGGPLIPAGQHSFAAGHVSGGGDDLWPTSTGSKYQRDLRANQIKTLVNADIKEAQKKGYLPKHIKFVVRSHRDKLDVTIIGAAKEQVYNDPDSPRRNDFTKQGSELLNRVQHIVRSYQYSQYDYIEGRTNMTNFWDHVDYESDWDKTRREEKEATAAARKAA